MMNNICSITRLTKMYVIALIRSVTEKLPPP